MCLISDADHISDTCTVIDKHAIEAYVLRYLENNHPDNVRKLMEHISSSDLFHGLCEEYTTDWIDKTVEDIIASLDP